MERFFSVAARAMSEGIDDETLLNAIALIDDQLMLTRDIDPNGYNSFIDELRNVLYNKSTA